MHVPCHMETGKCWKLDMQFFKIKSKVMSPNTILQARHYICCWNSIDKRVDLLIYSLKKKDQHSQYFKVFLYTWLRGSDLGLSSYMSVLKILLLWLHLIYNWHFLFVKLHFLIFCHSCHWYQKWASHSILWGQTPICVYQEVSRGLNFTRTDRIVL